MGLVVAFPNDHVESSSRETSIWLPNELAVGDHDVSVSEGFASII